MPNDEQGKRIQTADKIQGVVIYRGEVGIQFSRSLEGFWTELRMPIVEAQSLLKYLQKADEDGVLS